MQDFKPCSSLSGSGSLTDRRDNQIYTVAKINGNWWMTRNLAIGCNGSGSSYGSSMSSKQLTSTYSNISTNWSTPTASLGTDESYINAYMACSSTYGAWYNYPAASAGTITGNPNTSEQIYDICPSHWRLPTGTELNGIINYKADFKLVSGGHYTSAYLSGASGWWSSTMSGTTSRQFLYNSSILRMDSYYLPAGLYVRCIRSN